MLLLALELAARGFAVALVVYGGGDFLAEATAGLTLVERGRHVGGGGIRRAVREAARLVRALSVADGRVVVVRTGTPVVGVIAVYCRLTRRRLVFASANDLDVSVEKPVAWRRRQGLYRLGVRLSDAVVVQSSNQVVLAEKAFPRLRRLVRIPSFAEEPSVASTAREPKLFVWAGRLVEEKDPLRYAELAAEVPEARFVLVPLLRRDNPPAQQAMLEQLQNAAELAPNLQILDPLPRSELVELLAGAVAIVSTSVAEGMPNTFLEAWGLGVPALSLSFDAEHAIRDHGLGIAADGSWDRFVAGARELWNTRRDRAALSERTRTYVRTVHSAESVGDEWEALLGELGVERTGRSRGGHARR